MLYILTYIFDKRERIVAEMNTITVVLLLAWGAFIGGINIDKYNDLDTIYNYMESLSKKYPDIVLHVGNLGWTRENRSIRIIRISPRPLDNKAIIIDGGFHGNEWIGPAVALYIIRELVENRSQQPKNLTDYDIYVVPVINPDGYQYAFTTDRNWRKNRAKKNKTNCRGVDLNRNFEFRWSDRRGSSGNPCSRLYKGSRPLSEPEAQALTYVLRLESIQGYVSLQSHGQKIIYPPSGPWMGNRSSSSLSLDGTDIAQAMTKVGGATYEAESARNYYFRATANQTGKNAIRYASGTAIDFAFNNFGVDYTFAFKLGDSQKYGHNLPPELIIPTGKEVLEGIHAMVKVINKYKKI